ncbi:zinc finger protein 93 [Periophthalmus magnuspinnatus]|uniref:zinc finger protein 93 n=1 Tax=Periophthalmus magnuspinnatus TaxID=409849 RepID=UPI00145A8577|nr:zinc finger protein 93 [Periophthalmus magnuspinnatus]
MDSEAELSVSEAELGADFITVELDTQPIEYVVKWAEVGSKFTISCLKADQSELGDALKRDDSESELAEELRVDQSELQMDVADSFLAPYEEVYCDPCDPCDPCEVTHSVEVRTDWDSGSEQDLELNLGSAQLTEVGHMSEVGHLSEVVLESSQPDSDPDLDQSESEERQYRCSYCGKAYSHASSLYRHQQSHTGKTSTKRPSHESRPHTCPHCGLSFKGSRMLGSHLRLHGKRRIHPCNICGKEFNHSSSLSRHRLIHKKGKKDHPKMATHPHAPAHSNMTTLHPVKGRRGKRPPAATPLHPSKLYACPQCDMSFKSSAQLNKHQVTHVRALLGGFPPKDKENVSESQSDLKIRLKLCSRDKPNVYTLCEKRRRGLLPSDPSSASSGSEEDEPPARGRHHRCSQCGKRFGHASSLTRHLQTHMKSRLSSAHRRSGKTYTCGVCGKSFLHSSSFSRHKRAHREQQERLQETAPIESESD